MRKLFIIASFVWIKQNITEKCVPTTETTLLPIESFSRAGQQTEDGF